MAEQKRRYVDITSSYHGRREGNRPYRLDTVDDTAKKPRQRWYATYQEIFAAVERANPGTEVREA